MLEEREGQIQSLQEQLEDKIAEKKKAEDQLQIFLDASAETAIKELTLQLKTQLVAQQEKYSKKEKLLRQRYFHILSTSSHKNQSIEVQ